MKNTHEKVEKNIGLFVLFNNIAISIGVLVEITPFFFQ
jgi:cytochrome c oxidase cbb3-type subunit 2